MRKAIFLFIGIALFIVVEILLSTIPGTCFDSAMPDKEGGKRGRIIVEMCGLKEYRGEVRIKLFKKAANFNRRKRSYMAKCVPVTGETVTTSFEGLPYGEYAVLVHHDANADGRINMSPLGYPVEGYGAFNHLRKVRRGPKFSHSKFVLDKEAITIKIKMLYW
jgi:uncharacterized protein (DUF2141 family)